MWRRDERTRGGGAAVPRRAARGRGRAAASTAAAAAGRAGGGRSGASARPLIPLAPGERPRALLAATAVCVVLALAVLAGALTVHNLASRGGSVVGGVLLAGVLLMLAGGMYARRYWAVLGFEALLAFQIIVTSLALVVASTLPAAAGCVIAIGLGGWLFWKLVRVMGRIQAGDRAREGLGR